MSISGSHRLHISQSSSTSVHALPAWLQVEATCVAPPFVHTARATRIATRAHFLLFNLNHYFSTFTHSLSLPFTASSKHGLSLTLRSFPAQPHGPRNFTFTTRKAAPSKYKRPNDKLDPEHSSSSNFKTTTQTIVPTQPLDAKGIWPLRSVFIPTMSTAFWAEKPHTVKKPAGGEEFRMSTINCLDPLHILTSHRRLPSTT
jgi:hypothetical protein